MGPGGTFWATRYRQLYGPHATPLPIQAWQIWNEPNLSKFFAPYPSPTEYAQLLRISHNAIKAPDHNAQIVLAGMPGYGDVTRVAVPLWPLLAARDQALLRRGRTAPVRPGRRPSTSKQIQRVRAVMKNHGDRRDAALDHGDRLGLGAAGPLRDQQGPAGQAQLLKEGVRADPEPARRTWNVQRVFWYHWRDPRRSQANCSFCGSAGLRQRQPRPEAGLRRFMSFSADRRSRRRRASRRAPARGPHPRPDAHVQSSARTGSAPPSSAVFGRGS